MRMFEEMFRIFHLDGVELAPARAWIGRLCRFFARMPSALLAPPAWPPVMGLRSTGISSGSSTTCWPMDGGPGRMRGSSGRS